VTTAGERPNVTVGQPVSLSKLEALPWSTNGRSGVALTRSARVQVLFSCWARPRACCAARDKASSRGPAPTASASRAAALPVAACQTDGGDRRERDALGARELVRPAGVQLRGAGRAFRVSRVIADQPPVPRLGGRMAVSG
jgi:hypothetical protein